MIKNAEKKEKVFRASCTHGGCDILRVLAEKTRGEIDLAGSEPDFYALLPRLRRDAILLATPHIPVRAVAYRKSLAATR